MIFGRTSQRVFDSSQLDSRLKSGLITHYIGGGSGNTWIDKSGYGNHGVLTSGPIWSLSQDGVNNAVSLSGNNDYVSLPNFQSTPMLYSISCWAKRATVPGGYMVLCGLSPTYKVSLWVYETGVIGYGDAEFSSYGLTGNVWTDKTSFHHIAAVIDSANVWNIYFDGLKVASAVAASSAGTWSSSRIGLFAGALGSSFIGTISDFRIYNRAISQAEIATLSSRDFKPITVTNKSQIQKGITSNATALTINRRYSQRVFDSSLLDNRFKSGLIGYWSSGPEGNTWYDRSGYGHHGTLTNYTASNNQYTLGPENKRTAATFLAGTQYIDCGDFSSLDFGTGNFSICAWIRTNSVSTSIILAKDSDSNRQFNLALLSSGKLQLCVYSGGGAATTIYLSTTLITSNIWYHIVAQRIGNTVQMYFNGIDALAAYSFIDSNGGDFPVTMNATASPLTIGKRLVTASELPFNGKISDVRIYNRALSVAEITTISTMQYTPVNKGVRLYCSYLMSSSVSIIFCMAYESISNILSNKTISYESISNTSMPKQLAYESTIGYTKDNTVPFSSTQGMARGDTIAYESVSHFASASVIAYSSYTYENIDYIFGFESKSSASQSFLFEFESSSQVTNTSTFPYDSSAKICANYSFPYSSIYYVYSNKIISYESDGTAINTERTLYYWEISDRNTVWSITTEQELKWTINSRTTKWRIE